MTKENLIEKVKSEGYVVDLTFNNDCLYCSATDTNYLLSNIEIVNEYPFTDNGINKILKTVKSTEYNLTGFFVI